MSGFGWDGYALDGADAGADPHPLEIARDLIASGKPRSALEVLGLHYEQHLDDLEYLLLCAEAWRANGDTLRAQQALLGAARLAPTDPRPLHVLGDVLEERGESDKAARVLAKAKALEHTSADELEPIDSLVQEPDDDLIAAAERRERGHRAGVTPRQLGIGALSLALAGAIATALAFFSQPRSGNGLEPEPPVEPTQKDSDAPEAALRPGALLAPPASIDAPTVEVGPPSKAIPSIAELGQTDSQGVAIVEGAETAPAKTESESSAVPPASPWTAAPSHQARAGERRPSKRANGSSRREKKVAPAEKILEEPAPETVRAELESTDPAELTSRADALYEQGQTALAASFYRRALELDPDYAPALVGIGRGILRAEKYDDAMRNATRALQLARGVDARPGLEAEAIYQMGRVHLQRGEREAARQLLRQAVSLHGVPAEAWFYLGEALASDNSPAARRAYDRYLSLVPNGPLADRARRAIQ